MVEISLALLARLNSQLQLITLAFPIKMLLSLALLAWLVLDFPEGVHTIRRPGAAAGPRPAFCLRSRVMADSSKTEQPTGKRLEKARNEGQFVILARDCHGRAIPGVHRDCWAPGFLGWLAGMKAMMQQSLDAAFHGDSTSTTFPASLGYMLQRAFVPLSLLRRLAGADHPQRPTGGHQMGFSLKKFTPIYALQPVQQDQASMVSQGPAALLQAAAMLVVFSADDLCDRRSRMRRSFSRCRSPAWISACESRRFASRSCCGRRPACSWCSA